MQKVEPREALAALLLAELSGKPFFFTRIPSCLTLPYIDFFHDWRTFQLKSDSLNELDICKLKIAHVNVVTVYSWHGLSF